MFLLFFCPGFSIGVCPWGSPFGKILRKNRHNFALTWATTPRLISSLNPMQASHFILNLRIGFDPFYMTKSLILLELPYFLMPFVQIYYSYLINLNFRSRFDSVSSYKLQVNKSLDLRIILLKIDLNTHRNYPSLDSFNGILTNP